MLRSLVGSEMCIRDRTGTVPKPRRIDTQIEPSAPTSAGSNLPPATRVQRESVSAGNSPLTTRAAHKAKGTKVAEPQALPRNVEYMAKHAQKEKLAREKEAEKRARDFQALAAERDAYEDRQKAQMDALYKCLDKKAQKHKKDHFKDTG